MAGPGVPANSPLLNPNAPLSGKALYNAAVALANAQEDPTISGLQGAIGQNNHQTQNALNLTGGFYNQLGQQIQSGANQEGQISSGLASQLSGIGSDEQAQLRGIGQGAANTLQSYAPESGVALPSLLAESARQQGLAAQNEGAFRAFGATQGANYQGLGASQVGTGALSGEEALRSIATAGQMKNEPLSNRLASAISTRGSLVGTDLGKLRQQEINNGIAQAGVGIRRGQLGVAQQNAQTSRGRLQVTAQNDAANQNLRSQQIQATLRGQNLSHQDRVAALAERTAIQNLRLRTGGTKPLTNQQNNSMLTQLGALTTLIPNGVHHGLSEAQIRANFADGKNPSKKTYNPVLIDAAYELVRYGAISGSTAAQLHGMGIRGGSFNSQPIRVSRKPFSQGTVNKTVSGTNNAVNNVISGILGG